MTSLGQNSGETIKKPETVNEFEKYTNITTLTKDQDQRFRKLINNYKDICMLSNTKLEQTHLVEHTIDTGDHEPIASKPYKKNTERKKKIKKHVEKMLEDNIIRPSNSSWASPITIAPKKGEPDGRFCTDYRRLNAITKTDAYPLPRIDENWEQLQEARWFSTIDLASGYWQIKMSEEDRPKTSFT
jgi:hypothetical protein